MKVLNSRGKVTLPGTGRNGRLKIRDSRFNTADSGGKIHGLCAGGKGDNKSRFVQVCFIEQNPLSLKSLRKLPQGREFQVIGEKEVYEPQYSSLGARLILILDERVFAPQNRVFFRMLRAHLPHAKILVLGAGQPNGEACRLFVDMDGFVLYEDAKRELIPALRALSNGRPFLPPEVLEHFALLGLHPPAGNVLPLTPRELEVVHLVCAGLTNKEIAVKLGRSERTAKLHVMNIYKKLGVHDRYSAAQIARTLSASWAPPARLRDAHRQGILAVS